LPAIGIDGSAASLRLEAKFLDDRPPISRHRPFATHRELPASVGRVGLNGRVRSPFRKRAAAADRTHLDQLAALCLVAGRHGPSPMTARRDLRLAVFDEQRLCQPVIYGPLTAPASALDDFLVTLRLALRDPNPALDRRNAGTRVRAAAAWRASPADAH
jgi:hypothetical protein